MSWFAALTRNWAELSEASRVPALRPIRVARTPNEALNWAAHVIGGLPRWKVVACDPEACTVLATHATRLWGFIDDVQLWFVPDGSGTRIMGRSRSRVGYADFGQNARNLRELHEALCDEDPPGSA